MHYFGPWDDPRGALKRYNEQKDALHAGRKPRLDTEGMTVKAVVNAFLYAKETAVTNGELSSRTWTDYKKACDEVIAAFGKTRLVDDLDPQDFAGLRERMAKKWGPHRLGKMVQCIRCLFKYAAGSNLIDRPVRAGLDFKPPGKKTLRIHKAKQGPKLFTADEIRRLIDAAGQPLKAMLLLGINCGFGNADCGRLPISVVNLESGMIDYPRGKTGIARRCVLWPETVTCLRDALASRREPKNSANAGLMFVTRKGGSWHTNTTESPISYEVGKLLRRLGINGREGLGFYTLRHTFRTIADEAKDQPAADYIMGHEVTSMSSVYRERISDDRLKAVAEHVRRWLFSPSGDKPDATDEEKATAN